MMEARSDLHQADPDSHNLDHLRSIRSLLLTTLRRMDMRLTVITHRELLGFRTTLQSTLERIEQRIQQVSLENGVLREVDDFLQQMQVAMADAQLVDTGVEALQQVMSNRQHLLAKISQHQRFQNEAESLRAR